MTLPALSPTADAFANTTAPAWDTQILQKSWTWVTRLGFPEEVSDTLATWGSTLVSSVATMMEYPTTEVEAVEYIARVLNLSQVAVLRAVGVPKRTFHGWKGKGHKPRDGVKLRVWEVTALVADIAAFHKDVAAWFHSTPEVVEAFKSGDTHKLSMAELEWSSRNLKTQRPLVFGASDVVEIPNRSGVVTGFVSEDLDDQKPNRNSGLQ